MIWYHLLEHEDKSNPKGSEPIQDVDSAGRRQGDVDERCSAAVDRKIIGLGSHRIVVWVEVARVSW